MSRTPMPKSWRGRVDRPNGDEATFPILALNARLQARKLVQSLAAESGRPCRPGNLRAALALP